MPNLGIIPFRESTVSRRKSRKSPNTLEIHKKPTNIYSGM